MGRPVMFLLLAVILVCCEAQLTFSTGWGNGKRSVGADVTDPCTPPEETLYVVYKLLQTEAERIVACRDDAKN